MLTYGLSRSPTRAHFQNIPKTLQSPLSVHHCPRAGLQLMSLPILVPVHYPWHDRVRIGAGANYEQEYQQQRLEVEKRRLMIKQ